MSMTWEKFKAECEKLAGPVEVPPKDVDADLAFPCFSLAKQQKRSPNEIAEELAAKISKKRLALVKEVYASGPYVNFRINYGKFSSVVMREILKNSRYGSGKKKKEKVLIEFPGPNTNKPLHLGHMRNMVLGMSMSNMMKFLGYDVTNVDIINDRGVHICKSMLAYREFGNGAQPRGKGDHFVGDYYVLFSKRLEKEEGTTQKLRQMLVAWENGDEDVRSLWKKMNGWALTGLRETYKRFGARIDKPYYESDHYLDGKKIVMDCLKRRIFSKDSESNIVVDLEEYGLGKRVLLRSDGSSVYLTQDIALSVKRYKDFHMDRIIHVVGEEQREHFKALFRILEILGYKFAKNCYHLSYGMVLLPEGKMKSREGTVVDADSMMDEMHIMAENKLKERGVPDSQLNERAEKIGLGAIKYFLVKFDPVKPITYDPKASLDFEGDTGPYLQYTYARANSILKKSKKMPKPGKLAELKEFELVKKLSQFPSTVEKSAAEHKPNILANYLFELATLFNDFYHSVRVVGEPSEQQRLALVKCVARVLETGLGLLGIGVLKQM